MKMKTLAVLAGVSAPLILTGPSDAGFVGVKALKKLDGEAFGLWVVNVYAEFDNPGGDWMQSVAGTPNQPLNITVIGGSPAVTSLIAIRLGPVPGWANSSMSTVSPLKYADVLCH